MADDKNELRIQYMLAEIEREFRKHMELRDNVTILAEICLQGGGVKYTSVETNRKKIYSAI